jgi:hypothetical protein
MYIYIHFCMYVCMYVYVVHLESSTSGILDTGDPPADAEPVAVVVAIAAVAGGAPTATAATASN